MPPTRVHRGLSPFARAVAGGTSPDHDGGFAMILVIGLGLVLSLLVSVVAVYTLDSVHTARHEQDYQAALHAAEAGVNDYLARLNNNSAYWETNGDGVDCTNTAMQGPNSGANTCGWNNSTAVGWLPVPGATTGLGGSCAGQPVPFDCPAFHYDVNTSQTDSTGTITITSTGRSRNVTRTVQETLKEAGFADFLYFTNYEDQDPSTYANETQQQQQVCGGEYYWQRGANTDLCQYIYFTTRDQINGPAHSNDLMAMNGSPVFNGTTSTSDPNCPGSPASTTNCYWSNGGATPTFTKGITFQGVLPMPPYNTSLLAQATPCSGTVTSGCSTSPGCLYTGPTYIHFNSNGTMTVYSPYTQPGTTAASCYTSLPMTKDETVQVPENNVIFVQAVPGGQTTPANATLANGAIDGYPQSADLNYSGGGAYKEYNARSSTLFISGVLSGRVTATADNVIVVGNLTYNGGSSGTDSLGLIANNDVEVYHPVNAQTDANMNLPSCAASTAPSSACGQTFTNPTIDAAILAINHSFLVQDYQYGNPLQDLNIFGSIAQDFRGAVGTFSGSNIVSGYVKNYNYDVRLRYAPPPYFLTPSQTAWGSFTFAEIHPEY